MNFKNELSEELEFLLFYTSRRAGSIVRLMIVNSIFLLAMLGVYFYSRDAGYLLGNILSWFLPSLLCLALVVLFECYPQLLDKYGLRSPYAWKQVGYFLLSLRAYNLLRIVMEFLQIDFANGTVCTDFEGHMHGNVLSSVHIMVDYMEAYVWTGILFQAPWGVLFCTVEMCTTCLRLWSCLPILKPYISSVFNPHWFVVPYYVLLAVVHSFLIESYRRNMRDIDTVKSTIVNLKQEQEQAHRHVKISLQYIWGSLSKFKKLYVNPSDVRDNIKHAVSRNIKAATLIMDNLTVLHALENNTLTSGKTAVTDLLVVVRDLIMELEDFSVQHINIRKSLADDRARRSTLLCSEAIMQSVFGNVAYFIMSMIRRRSLRQRVGYNPYLNVCGYFYELLHKNGARQLMVRLVFDHNGDMMGDGAPDSSEVFDGTEIFEIPGSMGTKADHFINNATCVLSLRTYRVQTCRDVYSSTDRLASSGSLSPLCLSLLHDVLVQCGGSFLVQDYFIADDDVRSRTVQFGRIVVDLPCMDNSLKIIPRLGHKIFKSGSNIAISTDKKEEESIKYAVLLADKSLQATVLAGLRNFGVKTSVFAHKRILTGALDFDVDKILLERYTHVLFDVESVGLALRQGGFSGERVFFAANSIMLQSSQGVNASYDSVLPVPCRNNVLKRFVFSNANSMPAVVSKEYSSTEQLKNDVLSQYAQVEQIFMHIDRYARVGIFTELAKAKAPLLVLKFLQRFMIGLFSVFYFIFFDRIDTPINTTSHNPESLTSVKFGSQFSFSGVFLGMPLFARELERSFLVWRVCSAENGIISNTNELILSSFACFAVIMLPEIFTNRLPIFSLIGFFFTALLALLAKFGRKILKIDAVLNNSIAAIFLFVLLGSVVEISSIFLEYNDLKENITRQSSYLFLVLISFPLVTVLESLMLFYWKLTVLFHLTLIVRPVVFIYLLASNQFFHPTVLYCILAVTCMLICTSFSRIYEVEFFFRVSYQVMSWHSFRAFFVQSTRGLAHNDLRYPITSLLKLRSSIFLKLSDGLASKKDMIRLQPDVLENISILNLGFLKLEVINSALSLTGAINEGPMVETLKESAQIILIREELSYFSFIFELNENVNSEVHLMIHPQLSRICMDRQIFRMLIINAILRSVANGRSSNESLISSSNLRSSRITTKNDAQSTSPLRVRPDIHEILIQVGYTPNESDGFLSADDEIESKIMYKYLSCSSGKIGSSVKSRDNKLKFLTIAFVDNGVRDEYNGRTAGTNALCENLVTSVLGGTYESFELPPTSSFRNVYRFSIPIGPVDNEVNGSYDSYYGSKLWLSPTLYTCHGFERPSKRYEYIRKIYSDRILSHANKSELQLGRGEHVPWKMLLVHPDLDIARQIASAFQMEGWDYAVETSCSTALANPELFRFDLLVICTSALSFDGQLISITDLNFRGFFGGLICLCDSGGPPDNSNKISYHIMEIPILRKSVLLASEIADRALLNYLIGTDKIVSV